MSLNRGLLAISHFQEVPEYYRTYLTPDDLGVSAMSSRSATLAG